MLCHVLAEPARDAKSDQARAAFQQEELIQHNFVQRRVLAVLVAGNMISQACRSPCSRQKIIATTSLIREPLIWSAPTAYDCRQMQQLIEDPTKGHLWSHP